MVCTRIVAGSSCHTVRIQKPSTRLAARPRAIPRPQRSAFKTAAVAAFVEPASGGGSSTTVRPTTEESELVIDVCILYNNM